MRGQAAMEYLFTYGWAIFIAVIVLAILIGTNIFSAGWFTPSECVFQPDFTCQSYVLYRDGDASALEAALHNGLGFDITIERINLTARGMGIEGEQTYEHVPQPGLEQVASGEDYVLLYRFEGPSQPTVGSTKGILATVEYRSPSGELHYISGKITGRVERK